MRPLSDLEGGEYRINPHQHALLRIKQLQQQQQQQQKQKQQKQKKQKQQGFQREKPVQERCV